MDTGKAVLGILAGAAAGAFVGIMLAPDKGIETRRRISQKGEAYANIMKEKFSEFLDSLIEKFESVSEEVSDIGDSRRMRETELQNEIKASLS